MSSREISKHIPSSWKECKEKNVEICQIREIKDLYREKGEHSYIPYKHSVS